MTLPPIGKCLVALFLVVFVLKGITFLSFNMVSTDEGEGDVLETVVASADLNDNFSVGLCGLKGNIPEIIRILG